MILTIHNPKVFLFEIVKMFPNPVSDNLNVVLNATKNENVDIRVTDIVAKWFIK